jgi:hypothetical protein
VNIQRAHVFCCFFFFFFSLSFSKKDRKRKALARIRRVKKTLTENLWKALESIPDPGGWPGPDDADKKIDEWEERSVQIVHLGSSREGRLIRAGVFPLGDNPTRTMLAWGFPHPEEPIGAAGLMALGDLALEGNLPDLSDWTIVLIPCADPDQARKQLWLKDPRTAEDFVASSWRPIKIGLEVDYGFPIQWGPFERSPDDTEGRCRTTPECRDLHGGPPCPYANYPFTTLPESVALARAIDIFQPEVVASMHSNHSGGDYTFLLWREPDDIIEKMFLIPEEAGSCRHLGEPLDRGRRWKRKEPDLLQERRLEHKKKIFSRLPGYEEGHIYYANGSAGNYVENRPWKAQFICPETTLFRHPLFSDRSETEQKVVVRITDETRRGRRYRVLRFAHKGEWIVGHQERVDAQEKIIEEEKEILAPRSVLGVRALLRRRRALHDADLIWESIKNLPDLEWHPYLDERAGISVPGEYVGDGSMRVFRAREDYRRTATKAQAATFAWIWPLHTATLLGNFRNFLHAQDQNRAEIIWATEELSRIQDGELSAAPAGFLEEADYCISIRSQLARVLQLMLVDPRNP